MRERPSVKLTELLPDITLRPITVTTKMEPRLLRQSLRRATQEALPRLAVTKAQPVTLLTFAMARAAIATALEAAAAVTALATAAATAELVVADADPADC